MNNPQSHINKSEAHPEKPEEKKISELATKTKKRLGKKWWFVIAGVSVVLVTITTLIFSGLWYVVQLTPRTVSDIYHVIEIKPGSGKKAIAETLEDNKVIKSSTAFLWHTRFNNINSLQAGTYRLSSGDSTPKIAEVLAGGDTQTIDITITPGQRLKEIKQKLVRAGFTENDINAAIEEVKGHPLVKGVKNKDPLEGYLFPDTYNIAPTTTAEELVTLMLDTFQSKITPEIRRGLKEQGLSVHQGIILASIVQKEVSDYPTQQKVAQVFLKRLRDGVVLGSDVTFQYAAAEMGLAATPGLNSPYNTRRVNGLPPTAIANFNLSALEAVANPANTAYNYFVSGDNGVTYFSKTEVEHEALTRQHCQSCFQ